MKSFVAKVKFFGGTLFWILQTALLFTLMFLCSLRFLIPFPKSIRGNMFNEWKSFISYSIGLWVLFEISKGHKPEPRRF